MAVFIITCGTSLITNGLNNESRFLVNQNTNAKTIKKHRAEIEKIINEKMQLIKTISVENMKGLSAEMRGLMTYCSDQLNRNDTFILIGSDTYFGEMVTLILSEYLLTLGINAESVIIEGLQTEDYDLFHHSLNILIDRLHQYYEKYHRDQKIIYNLTGGFKSVNAFLQTVSQFFADESFYIFETADHVMRIPKLPISLECDDLIRKHSLLYRKLALNLEFEISKIKDLPDIMIYNYQGIYDLSYWGKILWLSMKPVIYEEKLLPPPSEKIVYSEKFTESAKNLTKDRFAILNHRIDDASVFFETNKENPLSSLRYKPLKGNPKSLSTHEIYAWSDADCKRIYLHVENGKYVFDELGLPLH